LVKSGKFFSIFAVLTLLILLAPAVILAPGQNVAANGAAVTQEVAGSLSFSESSPGDWWDFTAGGDGGINATYGLYLAQFTRADVTRTAAQGVVPNCTFRNYTTGSGAVTGDLSGSLSLAWITFNFNMTYPYTPKYMTANHFGWMTGRGHFYATNTSNNFTFVFIADFDSDNAAMSNAVGKGFLLSVEENGTFAGDKIIGDFVITKSGANYTGTYNLRIYPPNEVEDLSFLNVTGGVTQETTDDIHAPLALLDFETDGPQVTPTNMTTDFEEVGWGKDPSKVVTSGRLGTGGDMVVARNTALYLELGALWDPPGVRIMGTTVNNIYIDDTDTGNRTGDGSPYGKLWELLLLLIPNQQLPLGDNFTQSGYTLTPFGMLNNTRNPTQCYAGTENFAFATILISSSLTDALQWSVDRSFGLYPTPKVTSVNPNVGMPNTTMNVTIKGKYFLRANGEKSGWVANSGSVSFGPNVTVNSYSFKNSSPIDNEIRANISIAAGTADGTRDVNVTSCFGYASGNGIAPYKSGVLSDGFTISSAVGALQGHVDLKRKYAAGNATWETPLAVRFFAPGTKVEAGFSPINVITDAYGNFTAPGVGAGTYDVGVKNWTSLSRMSSGQVFSAGNTTTINFTTTGLLIEADTDNDDQVKLADFNRILGNFGKTPVSPGWDPMYDFDRSYKIDLADFNLVLGNFGGKGDIYKYQH
jgi:hypothetical protein